MRIYRGKTLTTLHSFSSILCLCANFFLREKGIEEKNQKQYGEQFTDILTFDARDNTQKTIQGWRSVPDSFSPLPTKRPAIREGTSIQVPGEKPQTLHIQGKKQNIFCGRAPSS